MRKQASACSVQNDLFMIEVFRQSFVLPVFTVIFGCGKKIILKRRAGRQKPRKDTDIRRCQKKLQTFLISLFMPVCRAIDNGSDCLAGGKPLERGQRILRSHQTDGQHEDACQKESCSVGWYGKKSGQP